jgi:hypothetical protein
MNARHRAVRLVYEQLIYVEVAIALNKTTEAPEGRNDGAVEALGSLQVRDTQVNVIDESSKVEFHAIRL